MRRHKQKKEVESQLIYPSYMAWSKRIYLLREGDKLIREGEVYIVKQVIKSVVANTKPRILLEKQTVSK